MASSTAEAQPARHLGDLFLGHDERRRDLHRDTAQPAADEAVLEREIGDDLGQARRRLERLGRELDGGGEAARAHLGDHRMPHEALLVGLREHRLELAHALDQALALDDREVREPGRRSARVAAVGVAVAEHLARRPR